MEEPLTTRLKNHVHCQLRTEDDGSPAKQKLFDEEYIIYCCVHVFLWVYLNEVCFEVNVLN